MSMNKELTALLESLTSNISDEELQLSLIQSDIAAKLISTRIKLEKSQAEFAEILGVTQGMISRWEQGAVNFTIKTLVSISQKLSLDLSVKLSDPLPTTEICSNNYTATGSNIIYFDKFKKSTPNASYTAYNRYEDLREM